MQKLLLLFPFFVFLSCGSGDEKKTNADSAVAQNVVAPQLKKGDFSDLSCAADGSNAYTVYLPSTYDSTKKFPVIIFFDAHGNGHLPLEKYKALAEKWNFIFIGSNVSKNGMPGDETMRIGNGLIAEAKNRFSASDIVLCGFSGGSRVAAAVAYGNPDVKGVICNSAAPQAPLEGKIYMGLAGLGDMNYLEMKKFEDGQSSNAYPHALFVFDGKHEWAPVNVFEDALLNCALYHSDGKYPPQDSTFAIALTKNIAVQFDSLKKASCLLAHNLLSNGFAAKTDANRSSISLAKMLAHDNDDPCLKSDQAAWKKAEDEENSLQNEISEAIINNDTTWWKANADKFFVTKSIGAEKFMRDRLRGYASLMCYSSANQAFRVNNLHAAEKFVSIYAIVDPTNSEWAYMKASLYMQLGLKDYVLPNLEKAVELGFNDHARLQNDPVFASLQNDPQFQGLFAKMK